MIVSNFAAIRSSLFRISHITPADVPRADHAMLCHELAFVRSVQLAAMQCKVTTHICGRIPWSGAEVLRGLAGQCDT